jgi:tungstate transport system ATP-binding protein
VALMTRADQAPGDALLALGGPPGGVGARVAVRDASIDVRRGDAIAVVGANGSGKTTLLRLLHGVVAHSGTRRVGTAAASQAMVFQRPFLLRLSVRHNLRIALWLAARGLSARERAARADEALARVGLQALADRPARALSGGEQQRLALARSWSVRPSILFLDEPTANLDPSAKREIEAMLAHLKADGMTMVMSTHNLGQAKRLATRVVYLDHGDIRADLPTARFFGEHLDGRADLFLKGELRWDTE